MRCTLFCAGLLLATVLSVSQTIAQEIQLDDRSSANPGHAQRVTLDSDSFTLLADKPRWIELRFRVAPGFHINSHTPKDDLLIPTTVKLAETGHLRVLADEYPAGIPLHLDLGSGETLSTYQGPFLIRLHVLAQKGDSVLSGTLHYQACDAASCFPPRDLPIHIAFTAR